MEFREISKRDAIHYCTWQEDHFFDRKAFGLKGDKVQRIAVAFANADGGEFVVGVSDEKESNDPSMRWKPVDKIEKFNEIIQNLSMPEPTIDYRCVFLRQKGVPGYVLHVTIEKGLQVHETSRKQVIVRNGAQSQELKGNLRIAELAYAKGQRSYEDITIPDANIDDLEASDHLREFANNLPADNIEPLDVLLKQNLVDKEWLPRVAAILLFSDNPSAILPKQCAIRIARYNTSDDDPERDDLTSDVFSIEKPIFEQIDRAYDKIVELLNVHEVWTMDGKRPMSFPKETIWELLVNAVIHRDYAISDNIFVGVFNDRIEIRSPGKLPGFVKVENILENRFSRNSKLVRLLSRYPTSPNKDLGEGVNTAFQRMMAVGKKTPEILEDGNFVKVTIRHCMDGEPIALIKMFAEKFGEISNRQARDITGIRDSSRITTIFSKLRDEGILVKDDSDLAKGIVWSLAAKL
ncbi:ATP-dependent DNA helicase RecG [Marinobacter persicus]|uniref:ATP-dependent DNA helicase RecG n=1 Tax=Marinobacter persicus TaxID=930118 RepID=A0A1I3VLM0_9GAMM|nr:ATP-binding protein [Marinobacter persicus]GHD51429.1 DNA-binding protein [Marinobacter persicus]SFJ95883.1 ATP-dependent DNA helicase RecG [Marinobacter persicus]